MCNDILCNSQTCPYKQKCARQLIDDPDNPYLSFVNFEYAGCDYDNGFDSYIPILTKQKN